MCYLTFGFQYFSMYTLLGGKVTAASEGTAETTFPVLRYFSSLTCPSGHRLSHLLYLVVAKMMCECSYKYRVSYLVLHAAAAMRQFSEEEWTVRIAAFCCCETIHMKTPMCKKSSPWISPATIQIRENLFLISVQKKAKIMNVCMDTTGIALE